jgi:hypothetical protein
MKNMSKDSAMVLTNVKNTIEQRLQDLQNLQSKNLSNKIATAVQNNIKLSTPPIIEYIDSNKQSIGSTFAPVGNTTTNQDGRIPSNQDTSRTITGSTTSST